MQIAHIQGIFSPEHGGPTQSLANYARGQISHGHRVSVWTLEGFPGMSPAMRLEPPIEMQIFPVGTPARFGCSAAMQRQLRAADSPEVYHLHGAWLRAMYYGAMEAMRRKRPYVLEVMGMYEPWCLGQKWSQKRIARWLYQDRILQNSSCLHVNSLPEAEHIRAQGFKSPIVVIPVGVDVDEIARKKSVVSKHSLWAELTGHPYILFLSRLHPKKGLDLLIRSWAWVLNSESDARRADWKLVIAGTGDKQYADECRELANQLGISDRCFWAGHVDDFQKSWLFSHAHCYVLPTFNDNFGNTVAEALAHGTPAITTDQTPWTDLVKYHCGWLVKNSEAELRMALNEAMHMDAVTRQQMGGIGESLVRSSYSLEFACRNILAVYEWLLGAAQPDCVMK